MTVAVSVRGLSKSYTIRHNDGEKHATLAEMVLSSVKRGFRRGRKETFWALKDLNFDVQQGDVVGVIGRNGAGKSTLLKILSRITEPTSGQIDLYGRVGSLLEVGTGFHPELTGRENIYLNGAILGMRKGEIKKQFDAIVDFANVERFLDTPVKRYSSGMYVRLAFAVAAHLRSEILIVDEVLAVGDSEFQRKCLGKMKDVAHDGRTVLFVSHNMASVQTLCSRAFFLQSGSCTFDGSVRGAIDRYVASFSETTPESNGPVRREGTGEYRFEWVRATKDAFACSDEKVIQFGLRSQKPWREKIYIACHLVNQLGATIIQCDSRLSGFWIDHQDTFTGELRIKNPWLKPGSYRVEMFICVHGSIIDRMEQAASLNVTDLLPYEYSASADGTSEGVVFSEFAYLPLGTPADDQQPVTPYAVAAAQ